MTMPSTMPISAARSVSCGMLVAGVDVLEPVPLDFLGSLRSLAQIRMDGVRSRSPRAPSGGEESE